MKGRVQLRIYCVDEAAAIWVRDQLVTRWTQTPRFQSVVEPERPPVVQQDYDGQWLVQADGRFETRADAEAIRDWLANQYDSFQAVRNRVTSIWGSVHNCRHDELVPTDCSTEQMISGQLRP